MNAQGWNWDEHYAKHCVRYYGWLPESVSYKKRYAVKTIKYFTLCGVKALDIFTFEKGKVLTRDNRKKLPNVVICEEKNDLVIEILKVVQPPIDEAVIPGKIQDIMFYDDSQLEKVEALVGRLGRKGVTARELRRIKDLKMCSEQLRDSFPFHIINFDTCGSLLNSKKLFPSFLKMVELQKGRIKSFLGFLTTECHNAEKSVEDTFRRCIEHNVLRHNEIEEALVMKHGSNGYDAIKDESVRLSFAFLKCVVIPKVAQLGWSTKILGIYVYENPNSNKILNVVAEFSDEHREIQDSDCIDQIVALIHNDPAFFSLDDARNNEEVMAHLNDIIEYRENIPSKYE